MSLAELSGRAQRTRGEIGFLFALGKPGAHDGAVVQDGGSDTAQGGGVIKY